MNRLLRASSGSWVVDRRKGGKYSNKTINPEIKKKWLALIKSENFKSYAARQKSSKKDEKEKCFHIRPVPRPLTLSFTDMSLVLKQGKKTVISNIFGRIQSFNITALMGPSGAGI